MTITKKVRKAPARDILTKARVQLLMEMPFFGHLALKMPFICSNTAGCGTTCVDDKGRLYYNSDFVESLSVQDAIFIIAHEVMHLVQRCHARFPAGGNFYAWNYAADLIINTMLMEANVKIGEKMKNGLLWGKEYQGKTTEEVYYKLLKQGKSGKKKGPGKGGGSGKGKDDPDEPTGNPDHAVGNKKCISGSLGGSRPDPETVEKWKQHIIAAAQVAKSKGNCPAFADDFLAELRKPQVTWKDLIRHSATSIFKGRYTWARPGRRSDAIGMRQMSRKPTKMGAVIMIDTSGSISDTELSQFVSECYGILTTCGVSWLKVYFHDTNCYHFEEYNRETIKKIKATRGGTSHVDVFEKVEENEDKIGMVIAFTDLATDFPSVAPDYPVIWGYPPGYGDQADIPFGRKIKVELG